MKNLLLLILLAGILSACDKKAPQAASSEAATPATALPTSIPDVGKIEPITITAQGVGVTPGAAINEALKSAIMQVNGVALTAISSNLHRLANAVTEVDIYSQSGHDWAKAHATLQGQAYADQIIAASKGVVSSFHILHVAPPKTKEGGDYTVDIEARIAKFAAPADSKKIKIVIAPLRSKASTFDIGGHKVAAPEVLQALQRQIVDALTQTGRFTVLDRQYSDEIQNELQIIESGQSVQTDMAKLGQTLSADLIWVGEINSLAYTRSSRQLKTSDRELVSYAGGWSISQRVINLATQQIQQSSTLQGRAPSIAATTLSSGINANQTLANMEADIAKQATQAILQHSFPVSIVERNGNQVILSQGGSALKPQSRYRIYQIGRELKDPQTGQSLGNVETACCEVVIDRVDANLSYGRLENIQITLDNLPAGSLQLRETLAPTALPSAQTVTRTAAAAKKSGATSHKKEEREPVAVQQDW